MCIRDRARAVLDRAQVEEDFLRHAVAELDKLDPKPGEEATLDARRRTMQGAERIRADILRANAAIAQGGAEGTLRDALRWLEGSSDRAEGKLDAALAALGLSLIHI